MSNLVRLTTHQALVDFRDAQTDIVGTVSVEIPGRDEIVYSLRTFREDMLPPRFRRGCRARSIEEHVRAALEMHPDLAAVTVRVREERDDG